MALHREEAMAIAKDQKAAPAQAGVNHIALEVGDIEEALAFMAGSSNSPCAAEQAAGLHRHGRSVHRLDGDKGQA
jgi:hypothetical protein